MNRSKWPDTTLGGRQQWLQQSLSVALRPAPLPRQSAAATDRQVCRVLLQFTLPGVHSLSKVAYEQYFVTHSLAKVGDFQWLWSSQAARSQIRELCCVAQPAPPSATHGAHSAVPQWYRTVWWYRRVGSMLARCSACTNDVQSSSEQPPAGAAAEQRSKAGGRSAALCRQPGWGALWRWLRGGTPSWIAGAGAGICVTPAWPRRVPPPSPHSSCGYSIISAQQQHPRPDQACCCAAAEQPVSTAPACAPPPHRRGGGRQECGSVNDARPRALSITDARMLAVRARRRGDCGPQAQSTQVTEKPFVQLHLAGQTRENRS